MTFFNISTESQSPAGYFIMKILNPIAEEFNTRHNAHEYGTCFDNIGFIAICTSEKLISEGVYPERRYIGWKRRYIDIRLYINYAQFLSSPMPERVYMCLKNIDECIDVVSERVGDKLNTAKFERDICEIAKKVHPTIDVDAIFMKSF